MNKKRKTKTPPPLSLRLTAAERKKLEIDAAGITLSAYIRECVFGQEKVKARVRKRLPTKDKKALAQVLGLLGQSHIANNLNQLAKDANCGSLLLDEDTAAKINEAYEHILYMRQNLIRALGLIEDSQNDS